MLAPAFAPHGEYEVRIDGRILISHVRGPWNKEVVVAYVREQIAAVSALSGSPWGLLATVHEEGMHTPDSFETLVEGIKRQQTLGRCATAVIFDRVYGEAMAKSIFEKMYAAAGEKSAFFSDETAARLWLQECIAEAEARAAGQVARSEGEA